jgi:hypothetical protein
MVEEIARWRKKEKTGRHLFVFQGERKTILPGDFVTCPERALGNQLKHYEKVLPAGTTFIAPIETIIGPPPPIKMPKIVRVSRGLFNVINPDNPDKPLNSKPLKKVDVEKFVEVFLTSELDWDQLVALMVERGIEVLPEYETEDDLRQALINAGE